MKIVEPKSLEEMKNYFFLRYKVLREPWKQPIGSEQDSDESSSIHRMIVDSNTSKIIAVGRLHFNNNKESQIRYMAVSPEFQNQGLGTKILFELEKIAISKGANRMILQSRENAIEFYRKNGYSTICETDSSFGNIIHYRMEKNLDN